MKLKCSMVAPKEPTQTQWAGLMRRSFVSLGLFGLVIIGIGLALSTAQGVPLRDAHNLKLWASRYARLPLSFEANRGQTDSRVKFLARGPNYTLFLTEHEAVLALRSGKPGPAGKQVSDLTVVRLRLMGSAPAVRLTGQSLMRGTSNYFLGNDPRHWHTNIPNYAQVRYHRVYRDIDLVYHGSQGKLENDFILAPGANPNSIRIGLEGVDSLQLDHSGDLVLKIGDSNFYLRRPRAHQGRNEVSVQYVLKARNQVGLALGRYDHRQKLVIDPVLAFSTYLGGGGGDNGYGIAVDSSGNAYVTGFTNSSDFPTTSGSQSTTSGGSGDVFVAKLDPTGPAGSLTTPQLVYSTYLGGGGKDSGQAITLDAGGDAYVTGITYSTNFPTTSGAFQTTYGGAGDAFVTEVNSTGAGLVYSTYLGGTGLDEGMGIAVDSSNNAYITGSTQSPNFPTLSPAQTLNAGSSDAFVTELNFTGTALVYSTYLGGSQVDVGTSIKVDGSGNAYVAGYTFSTDFPLQNPVQGSNAGTVNAFVTELSPGSLGVTPSILYSTYLGGSGDDRAYGLALDSSGNVYIAGSSKSTDFPTTTGVVQGTNLGLSDAFVAKLNPAGPAVTYATLLGGSGNDQANGIAVDSSGDAFVTGFTNSSDFPTFNPIQTLLGITGGSASCGTSTCTDAFVAELNPTATALVQSTYLGGSGADYGQAIAVGPKGNPFITGTTSSSNFPAIAGAYQSALNGVAGNAFVAEIDPANSPGISIVPQTVDFGTQTEFVRSNAQT
ncbi:MAG: SBBP repeat-containing protein, partial [Acidobacteria bacterium]|nr:SBBP repeat-containing protein [Acidobacteriota bacterium]